MDLDILSISWYSLCQTLFRPLAIRASGQFRSTCPNQILLDQILDKTASFQKEAMRTQVALYFFLWSEICIE